MCDICERGNTITSGNSLHTKSGKTDVKVNIFVKDGSYVWFHESTSSDNGDQVSLHFSYFVDIKYCPFCGRELSIEPNVD